MNDRPDRDPEAQPPFAKLMGMNITHLSRDRVVAELFVFRGEAASERGRYIDTQPKRLRPTEVRDAYARASRRARKQQDGPGNRAAAPARGSQPQGHRGLRFTLHLARMMRGILVYLALPW